MVTQARLQEIFIYDEKLGRFIAIIGKKGLAKGKVAGSTRPDGYRYVQVDKVRFLEHRLVWLWHYGCLPLLCLDHINRNKSDNRIENLREVTLSQNALNIDHPNKSGFRGVSWHKDNKKWRACIRSNGKAIHLGNFDCKIEAAKAYNEAAQRLHGTFANLNEFP